MEMHYKIGGVEAKYNHWIGFDGYDFEDINYVTPILNTAILNIL